MAEWLLVLGMAFGVGAAYLAWKGIWVEPKQLTVERYILTLERLPEPSGRIDNRFPHRPAPAAKRFRG